MEKLNVTNAPGILILNGKAPLTGITISLRLFIVETVKVVIYPNWKGVIIVLHVAQNLVTKQILYGVRFVMNHILQKILQTSMALIYLVVADVREKVMVNKKIRRKFYGKRKKLCVYCGENDADTTDHVPPKSILLDPYPPNLPTVPACSSCNHGFGRDFDEKIKIYLATLLVANSQSDCRHHSVEKLLSSAKRTLSNNNKLKNQLKTNIGPLVNGKHFVKIPIEDRVQHRKFLERVVKGLFYHQYERVIPKEYVVDVFDLMDKPIGPIFPKIDVKPKKISIADDVFFALHAEADDLEGASLWELNFYNIYIHRGLLQCQKSKLIMQ